MRAKGRYWVAGWLIFFLAILAWVASRQTAAVVAAAELEQLRQQRTALEARQGELLARIRTARSREVLIPRAQAMGLRLPADSEIIILPVPQSDRR
jgi:hypothetical protein